MARLPTIAGTKMLALGGVLLVGNDMLVKNKWLGYGAEAALLLGAFEAGRGGFTGTAPGRGQPALQGEDEFSGDM